jgi:hypothetical protein
MKNTLCILVLLLVASAKSGAQLPAYLPSYGLVAWFPFTGNAVDSTGNGHNGTLYGPTMAKGRYGTPNSAYQFNGTSNYIYIPPGTLVQEQSVDITASLTISAWVKSYNYFFSSQQQIYWRGDATPAHDPHMLYLNGGQVRIRRDIDPGATVTEVGSSLSGLDTNYHLFTGTYDSATSMMCMYVDGILKTKNYLPGLQTYPTSTMYNYIGAVDGGTWQFFYGFIDELGIWRRALSACEVAALYYSVPNIITAHPGNDTVTAGGTATFAVSVSAPAPTYQWQVNAGSGFVNLSNTPPYSGVYTATLTVSPATTSLSGNLYRCSISSDSCLNRFSDSSKLIVAPSTVEILPLAATVNISVAPNPNAGTFSIIAHAPHNEELFVEVTDVAGKVLQKEELFPVNGQIKKEVSLNRDIAGGIYLLRVRSMSTNEVFRIIVER